MHRDPRCMKYRKPRTFHGTPFAKYINAAIGISCVIVCAFSYSLFHIPLIQETLNKFKYDISTDFNGSDMMELHLEEILNERLRIREEEAAKNQEKKEVHT